MSYSDSRSHSAINPATLLLAEYERIKEEQKARIIFRDSLLYATLGSLAAVVAVVVESGGNTGLLLLLPPVAALLGWTYLVNDEKVSAAGSYVRKVIAPRLAEAVGTDVPVFGWETAHRADARRWSRKATQLFVDLAAFCAIPAAALGVYWSYGPYQAGYLVVSAVEAVMVATLAIQITLYADLSASART